LCHLRSQTSTKLRRNQQLQEFASATFFPAPSPPKPLRLLAIRLPYPTAFPPGISVARRRQIHHPFHLPFESSFRSEYLDPHGSVEFYARRLSSYAKSWKVHGSQSWDGSYTSLASSSSTGKTRLLKELAINHNPTIYLCLRDEDEEGYPKGNLPILARRYCVDPATKALWESSFIALVTGILAAVR
jgi:hypothetical protein